MKAPPSIKGVVIDKKLFSRAIKDKKTKGNEKAVLDKIDKEQDKELGDLKDLLDREADDADRRRVNSNGVNNKYKEEQIKKGAKFSPKVLQAIDYITVDPTEWTTEKKRERTGSPAHPQLHHPLQRHQRCLQAEEIPGEHRRRTACRYREAREGLCGREAQAGRRRQDGRPPR